MSPSRLIKRMIGQLRHYSAPTEGAVPPSKQKYVPTSGTYPKGFVAGTTHVGVKASNTRLDDLAIIASESPCAAAAVFTQNKFQAAPVLVSRDVLRRTEGEGVRAVVINSGCANAVTGKGGIEDAEEMGRETNKLLGPDGGDGGTRTGDSTIVMSTGVIGQRLPIRKIIPGIGHAYSRLGDSHTHWLRAARSICTTDTFPKLLSKSFILSQFPDASFSLVGITKGAGMIHPNMATLLGVICTDAPLAASVLHPLLQASVGKSFNAISVDGDTSTNDTVALLANGAASHAGNVITGPSSPSYAEFGTILTDFATELAQLVVRDGEGATKFVTVRVVGGPTDDAARRVASSIVRSPLVKTALYGRDANWGRILCAIGYADGVDDKDVVPSETSVSFVPRDGSGELRLLVKGEPEVVDEERAGELLEAEDLEILVRLSDGGEGRQGEATYWTCDFSHEYVTINGDYRT